MKNKVSKYLENHFITESFFCTFWHTVLILQNLKLPYLSVSVIFLWISVQQVESFHKWTPIRYLETFIETFARKWLTAQSLGQEIWKVCFPKKIIRFISRFDWKHQNLCYIKAYIYAAASYTKEHGGCGLLCKSPTMNRKCEQCMIG